MTRSYISVERTERRAIICSQLSKGFSLEVRAWLWNRRKYLAPPSVEEWKLSGNFHLFHHEGVSSVTRECPEIRPIYWPYYPDL